MVQVRPADVSDAPRLAAIYNHYIRTSIATFELTPVDAAEFRQRLDRVLGSGLPWLVAETDHGTRGYAYATPWRTRAAYAGSVESTVYVDADARGEGLGRTLCEALFERLVGLQKHVVIAGISLPNAASVALHEGLGMHNVAHFEQVGRKFDRWVDVGYWQRRL
ncbi:MAG: GNAT family N-acetyltransferase [Nannocystales bacterium]